MKLTIRENNGVVKGEGCIICNQRNDNPELSVHCLKMLTTPLPTKTGAREGITVPLNRLIIDGRFTKPTTNLYGYSVPTSATKANEQIPTIPNIRGVHGSGFYHLRLLSHFRPKNTDTNCFKKPFAYGTITQAHHTILRVSSGLVLNIIIV